MSEIVFENVRKRFDSTEVIRGVNMRILSGEFVVFVGPSGCGKSTLLRLIAGLEEITSGTLRIDGRIVNDTPPAERGLAMVFQSYALYPHMTAYENMAFGLRQSGAKKAEIDASVREAARILHIDELLDRKPKQLSGGQRQRVAIGRAIVRKPSVFLFDEPLSNLDAALRVRMRIEIAKLHQELGVTMIYVTHDQAEAMTLADRIVVLRQGIVEQMGTPMELYHRPANKFVAGFIGSPKMNFLAGTVAAAGDDGVTVLVDGGEAIRAMVKGEHVEKGASVELGIRPEHALLSNDGPGFPGRIDFIEQLGDFQFAYVSMGNGEMLTIRIDSSIPVTQGGVARIHLPAADCHVFLSNGSALERLVGSEVRSVPPLGRLA